MEYPSLFKIICDSPIFQSQILGQIGDHNHVFEAIAGLFFKITIVMMKGPNENFAECKD